MKKWKGSKSSWAASFALMAALLGTGTSAGVFAQTGTETISGATTAIGDRVVGLVAPAQLVQFSLQLPYRNQAGLDDLQRRLYTFGDPLFHQFLSSQQFNERFAPSQAQYDALLALARRSGMTVRAIHSGRTLLDVEAPAATVQNLFSVRMRQLQTAEGKIFNAPDGEAALPFEFAAMGASVAGLYQRPLRPHHILKGQVFLPYPEGSPEAATVSPHAGSVSGSYAPADIRKAYNTNALPQTGVGQTIALYELSTASIDTDIQHYIAQFGLPARTTSSFISTRGSGTSDTSGAAEVILDIDMVLAMMPSIGKILVYTEPNGSGSITCYQEIADDNLAPVVSTSWGVDEGSAYSFSNAASEKPIFQKMLTQGQAIFAAAGDSGAYDDGSTLSVDDPASQTNVTGVGGTTLTTDSSQAYTSESTWNNPSDHSRSAHGAGGGGGISQHVSIPTYQQGVVSNAPAGEFSTTFRNVPDVSLDADPATGYVLYLAAGEAGTGAAAGLYAFGGTSAAAPLWASFWTQINQALLAKSKPVAGFANPLIYQFAKNATSYASDFHDVNDNSTNLHFHAVNGYDTASGWGSFNGANLQQDIVNYLSGGVPTAPTSLTATGSDSQITLNWTASSGATSYNIYKSTSSHGEAPPVVLSVAGGSSNTATITGLTNGTTYYFVIQAINSSGHSLNSNEASARAGTVPAAPASLTATAGNSQIILNWTASSGATSYNIYKSTSSHGEAPPVALSVAGGSSNTATITGLTNGTTYYFVVQAINSSGHSLNSNEASAKPN